MVRKIACGFVIGICVAALIAAVIASCYTGYLFGVHMYHIGLQDFGSMVPGILLGIIFGVITAGALIAIFGFVLLKIISIMSEIIEGGA